MNLRQWHERWKRFAETERGTSAVKAIRGIFAVAVVGMLVYQISAIGWGLVLSSLPGHPLFYLLVVGMYALLPVTESFIYARIWSLRPLECLGVMIRKRVLNVDVVGYSGEIYLFVWAKDRVEQAPGAVMGAIKDNLIVSSVSSLAAAGVLIGGLLLAGQIPVDELVSAPNPVYVALGLLVGLFLLIVAYRFRHVIFSLPRRILAALTAAHVTRFVLGYVLQVAAWWIVIPAASFQTWAVLLVVFVVINRIPFLPSSDLVFVSAGAGITPLLDVAVAPVVGMLLVRSAADRLLNLMFFTSSVWFERQQVSSEKDGIAPGNLPATPDAPSDEADSSGGASAHRPEALKT